jgi:hypothetical protein
MPLSLPGAAALLAAALAIHSTPNRANELQPGVVSLRDLSSQGCDARGIPCQRWWFRADRGRHLVLTMHAEVASLDPVLEITGPGLAYPLRGDDVSPANHDARIELVILRTGVFAVEAQGYARGQHGRYTLLLESVIERMPANAEVATPVRAKTGPRIYAVLVGVSDYAGRRNALRYVREDPVNLARVIRDRGALADASLILTDSGATAERVRRAIQAVADSAGRDDIFLFFFSGHGGQLPTADPSETDGLDETIAMFDREVRDDEMRRWLETVRAGRVIIAIDACFSGGFARDVITRDGELGLFSSEEAFTSIVPPDLQSGGYLAAFLQRAFAGEADVGPADHVIQTGELRRFLEEAYDHEIKSADARTRDGRRGRQRIVVQGAASHLSDTLLVY